MSKRWIVLTLVAFYPLVVFGGAALKAEYNHLSQYISELNAAGEWTPLSGSSAILVKFGKRDKIGVKR